MVLTNKNRVPHPTTPTTFQSSSTAEGRNEAGASAVEQGRLQQGRVPVDSSRPNESFFPEITASQTRTRELPGQDMSEIDPLAVHVKDALSTINKLQCLGLQRLRIPLPKCIVLGEQSTGKSSVIEAISGIKTPREDDTCTRCPLFITLEPSTDPDAAWSARITLQRSFEWDGKKGRSYERRFPGWVQTTQPLNFDFATTNDPNELEDLIRRAQLATLSPLLECQDFLQPSLGSTQSLHKCDFSPNVVCISVSQPGLPSLSFYDLPGIIGQAESASSQYLVKFVRDLVEDYVKDQDALILVTYSLENDIANSSAGGIAHNLKATNRCIGVLTKPDRLPAGTRHEKLREVFDGKRFTLGHGYFVVKNPGQDEVNRGLTHKDARALEQRFFALTAPWSDSFRDYASRFGTLRLQRFLSSKLATQITDKLPIIQEEIAARLTEVESALKQYPEPPSHNASRIISDIVLDFSQQVRRELDAEFPCVDWQNSWEALQKVFFAALMSLKPTMTVSGIRDKGIYIQTISSNMAGVLSDPVVIDSDDEENEPQTTDLPKMPTKKRKVDGTPAPSPIKTSSNCIGSTIPDKYAKFNLSDKKLNFQLDRVADHLNEMSKSRIPGQIEIRVIYAMMLETLQHWQLPLDTFFNTLERQMTSQMKVLFHHYFSKWKGSALYAAAWKIVEEMMQHNFVQQRTIMAADSLKDERKGPYIFHRDIFNQETAAMVEYYAQARFKARVSLYRKEREQRTNKPVTQNDELKLKKDAKAMAILHREPYSIEIGVVAQITTYYTLAARRFHDAICMRIESKFFEQLRTQLRDELENRLGIHDVGTGHLTALNLLAEQSDRERQRRDLIAKKNALLEGQNVLLELQNKKYDDMTAPIASRASSTCTMDKFGEPMRSMPTPMSEEHDEV